MKISCNALIPTFFSQTFLEYFPETNRVKIILPYILTSNSRYDEFREILEAEFLLQCVIPEEATLHRQPKPLQSNLSQPNLSFFNISVCNLTF